jgi:hypothetical protein
VAVFPFADFLQTPALLGGCGVVAAGSAIFEAFGDPGAVFLRVVVVVLELGGNAGDVEAQTADSWEHPAIRRYVHSDLGVVALWLEMR